MSWLSEKRKRRSPIARAGVTSCLLGMYVLSAVRAFMPTGHGAENLAAACDGAATLEAVDCCFIALHGKTAAPGATAPTHGPLPQCAFCLLNYMPAEQSPATIAPSPCRHEPPTDEIAAMAPDLPIVPSPSAPRDPPPAKTNARS